MVSSRVPIFYLDMHDKQLCTYCSENSSAARFAGCVM